MKPWPSTNRKGAIGEAIEGLLGLGLYGGALIALPTAAVLAVLGTDLVVSLAAIIGGMIAGWLVMSAFIVVGMGFFSGSAASDRPSRGEHFLFMLAVVVPPLVASGATVISAQLLAGVSRPLIGVALLVLGLVAAITATIASMRRSAGEAARRAYWLRDRDTAAARDPEFAEQLRTEGWRVDGPYDEMRAVYFRAWNSVKEARRASGRPTWGKNDDPLEPPD